MRDDTVAPISLERILETREFGVILVQIIPWRSRLAGLIVAAMLAGPGATHAQDDARTKQLRLLCARLAGDFASPSGIIAFRRCLNQNPLSAMRRNAFGPGAGGAGAAAAGEPEPPPQPPAGFGRDSRTELASAVARFQAVDNALYVLATDGKLWRKAIGSHDGAVILDSVASFRALDATTFYALDPLGKLSRVTGDTAARQHVDAGVATFQPLDHKSVFVLGQDARLWRVTGDSNDKALVDSEVASFQAIDAATIYVRGKDGKLWRENGSSADRTWISSNVAEFRIEGETAYVLTTADELWRRTGDDKPVKISSDVRAFQPAGARWIYVLIKAGGLWVGEGPSKPRAFVDSDLLVEAGAMSFQALDAEHVYVLGADRKLWAETMPLLQP